MKTYPSIGRSFITNTNAYLFDKLDGSNIRAEWNPKKGFYKFGSRTQLIGDDSPILGESIKLINDKYCDELSSRFISAKYQSAVCFFEFFGENSFAGSHREEPHDVVLFDISPYKIGLLPPEKFMKMTDGLHIPKLVMVGKMNHEIFGQIKRSELDEITFEGVVGKYEIKNQIVMFKIKTELWLERLRSYCGNNDQLFEKLK